MRILKQSQATSTSRVRTIVFALLSCLLATSGALSQAPGVLNDLSGDERGPGFQETANGVSWLDTSNFYGMSYLEVQAALLGSGYRLARTDEVQRLATSVGRPNPAMGTPTSFMNVNQLLQGRFDDSATGSDDDKVGFANAFTNVTGPNPGEGFDVFEDSMSPDVGSISIGAWVVQQTAVECDANAETLDFDCDGINDKVVWRPASGTWFVRLSSNNQTIVQQWGLPGDIPIAGDYDGDGVPDLAAWRPTTGVWYIKTSKTQYSITNAIVLQFGLPGDRPLRMDYDGDNRLDVSVWRPSTGEFFSVRSIDAAVVVEQWGLPGDVPVSQ